MRILLIKFRHIGDVLLSTPLLANLKQHFPDAEVDFAVNDFCRDILSHNPHLNRLWLYPRDRVRTLLNPLARGRAELRYLSGIRERPYDLLINLTEGDRGAFLAVTTRAARKLGFRPRKGVLSWWPVFSGVGNEHLPTHTVNKDLQFLGMLNRPVLHKRVSIQWDAQDERTVDALLRAQGVGEFCLAHPVARWRFKCWDDGKFAEVIDRVQGLGLRVVVSASPNPTERRRVERLVGQCQTRPVDLGGQLNLRELACLAARARLFVGVDTAPMHIAAAVNTPVVALFGHSEALYWGPWDNDLDQDYRNDGGIQRHGRHTLIQKYHGGLEMRDGTRVSPALMAIEPAEVLAEVERVLARQGK